MEITGVSRSGRVRKKPSKFMDYENIDIHLNAMEKETEESLVSVHIKEEPQDLVEENGEPENFSLEVTKVKIESVAPVGKVAEPGPSRSSGCIVRVGHNGGSTRNISNGGMIQPTVSLSHKRKLNRVSPLEAAQVLANSFKKGRHKPDRSGCFPDRGNIYYCSKAQKDRGFGPKGSLSHVYYCHHCNFASVIKDRLRIHVVIHLPREHSCTICSFKSKTKQYLEKHMKTHTGEKNLTCTRCDFKTSWPQNLMLHIRRHNNVKPYSCHLCPYKSATSGALRLHVDRHHDVRNWKCPFCSYAAAEKTCLLEHVTRHTGEKNNLCKQCNFRTSRKSSLRDHVRLLHVKNKSFQCPDCDYRSAHKGNLKLHIRTHTNERPYQCELCDYRSATGYTLKYHMRTHTGDRPIPCPHCNQRFTHPSTRHSHIKAIHLKLTPYECHYCSWKTGRKLNLSSHIKRHFGIHDKRCRFPGCRFHTRYSSSLVIHKRTHLEEVAFSCDKCLYTAANVGLLRSHLRTHLEVKPFKCELCDYATSLKANMESHTLTHNRD